MKTHNKKKKYEIKPSITQDQQEIILSLDNLISSNFIFNQKLISFENLPQGQHVEE